MFYDPKDKYKIWIEPIFLCCLVLTIHFYAFLSDTFTFLIVFGLLALTIITLTMTEEHSQLIILDDSVDDAYIATDRC